MIPDITPELTFRTARSGGSGGQNVNKVETMVEGSWNPATSKLFDEAQKVLLLEKLTHRINKAGDVQVRSQVHRSQLSNKEEVIRKFNGLVQKALEKKRPRIATKIPKGIAERRIESKKKTAEKKQFRGKVNW